MGVPPVGERRELRKEDNHRIEPSRVSSCLNQGVLRGEFGEHFSDFCRCDPARSVEGTQHGPTVGPPGVMERRDNGGPVAVGRCGAPASQTGVPSQGVVQAQSPRAALPADSKGPRIRDRMLTAGECSAAIDLQGGGNSSPATTCTRSCRACPRGPRSSTPHPGHPFQPFPAQGGIG